MEKLTKCDGAGWRIDFETLRARPATPLEYLERLALVNEILGDDIQFECVEFLPDRFYSTHIRTSQPHIEGGPPAASDLHDWLSAEGFDFCANVKVGAYDATAYRRANIWLFDVRPMNFVVNDLTPDRDIVPIDVIVQHQSNG